MLFHSLGVLPIYNDIVDQLASFDVRPMVRVATWC